MQVKRRTKKSSSDASLEGQLLLAMPNMTDKRFQRSVIYMCTHSSDGAMGLIINQKASGVTFPGLMKHRVARHDRDHRAADHADLQFVRKRLLVA